MASKRKSTVPCMIPSKNKHMREDIILGCLPELLPTIPEDSILSISSKDEDIQRFHDLSKAEHKTSCWERGTYSCPLCSLDSGDLNLFLHHMDNCHMDFHAQPNFYCLSCKVSAVKFEGLALHNAKSHPELHTAHNRVSLQATKRDGAITVEQTVFTEEDFSESGISITKTPIMKMTKGGHKKIVVSHTVEVHRAEPSSDKPATITNGTSVRTLHLTTSPHVIGGADAPLIHKIPNTLAIPGMQNRGPVWNSNPSSPDSSADLPKVMIPLSSIPTYDPTMDLSSFLKTSFGKFPYPTKAELCYLTVVSGFPEEQIKLWFTAQRLKQGISWSPEEIEDTRRKMFNTVFQAPQKMSQNQLHQHISQHCVSVQSTLNSNYIHRIPKGSVMGWKGGVIVSQPSVTQATSLKQPQKQVPQVNIHHAVITKETGNDLSCRTVENCNIAIQGGINHRHTGKGETGCSSTIKTGVSCLPGASKSQNSSYSEGSIMNLTNIVRKIDCHVNDRNTNCTSKANISPTSIYGQQKASSNPKESSSSRFATTSKYNNGSTYKSTSHSTICTKREGNILDHTSKSNTDTTVICSSSSSNNIRTDEFMLPLGHSLIPQPGSMDPSLGKAKALPEQPGILKQSFIHNSFPEQKQFLTPQGQSYHVRTLTGSQSALGGSFSNFPQSSLQSNPGASSRVQEEQSQHSSPSRSAPPQQHSPKAPLEAAQVQSTDFTAVHYKERDPKQLPALDKDYKQSHFDKEPLHENIAQKENEGRLSEQHSAIKNTSYKADKSEHSNLVNTLHPFTNDNTNKAKQGMPLLRQYIQEVDQWESNSTHPEGSNMSPKKVNVIALNKDESLYKSNNSKHLISKPLESLINDCGPSHTNDSSEWHESYRHIPVETEEHISDTSNTELHQSENFMGLDTEQVKRDLCPKRKSIFQSLHSDAPMLPIKKKSKEAMAEIDKASAGEQDYWEIKDDERQKPMGNQSLRGHQAQDSQSRDCLRGELLKV